MNDRARMRAATLEKVFVPFVKAAFDKDPATRSAMLCVAQYWADEADDAVHDLVVFSERDTPWWPHRCRERAEDESGRIATGDRCSYCAGGDWEDRYMEWHDNGSAIPAFEAFCSETGNQESDVADSYLPYAVARREGDAVRVTIVGRVVRPHLELGEPLARAQAAPDLEPLFDAVYAAPHDVAVRHVLADALLERGDPRGDFIALSLHGGAGDRIERSLLGPLAAVVPEGEARFARGFPSVVGVYLSEETLPQVVGAREWATIETLRFLNGSLEYLGPEMRALRDVSLRSAGLDLLRQHGARLPIRRLSVTFDEPDDVRGRQPALLLPQLEQLSVGVEVGMQGLLELLGGRPLASLEVRSLSPSIVSSWLAAPRMAKTLSFVSCRHTPDQWGLRLTVGDGHARLEMAGLDSDLSLAQVGEILGLLPASIGSVELASNVLWSPTEDERVLLSSAARRPVVTRTAPGSTAA